MAKAIYFAFVVQCIVLYGGIDLNFKTPLLTDLPQFRTTDQPPADRLVLIISDGLRAERLYEGLDVTPHLNEIRRNRGVWGISIASVPTESRPGHVSLLAGIYEDPSAIFRGWQDNPVDFDSVINQSANAYGWGSPDILNLFNKGKNKTNVDPSSCCKVVMIFFKVIILILISTHTLVKCKALTIRPLIWIAG